MLPALEPEARLVGYRVTAHGARRLSELLRPGDCVVVRLGSDAPPADAPCAVRIGARIELARVRVREGLVYLPPSAEANDSARSEVRIGAAEHVLVGRVVLTFRRWL